MADRLAHAEQELIGKSFERTIIGEGGCGQHIERADALLQKFSGHLKDRLRKAVVEAQLVGAGGVIDDELPRGDDSFAAVLEHAVHAAVSQRHQHEIFAGARDPRRRAEYPLGAGIDPRTRHRSDYRLRNRTPKRVVHLGAAIKSDKGIADDVLPDRKPAIRHRGTRVEHDSHDGPPRIRKKSVGQKAWLKSSACK